MLSSASNRQPLLRFSATALSIVTAAACSQDVVSPGILTLTPDALTASASVSSTIRRAMTIHTENQGAGLLHWVATVKHASQWLSIQEDTGTAGIDSVLVWADPTGLAPGVYRDTVVVRADLGKVAQVPIAFVIMPIVATNLRFTEQPSNAAAGSGMVPVQVTALDALGNVVTSFARGVSVTIVPDTGGASVGGTATASAVAGVATFSNLGIQNAGCYRLIASSADLRPDTSSTFCITPGPASALSFKVPPAVSTFSCGTGLTVAPFAVRVVDAFDNTVVSDTRQVQVALGSNPGSGTLSGTTTVAAVAGVATFADLTIDRAATGYTLVATATGLTGATSAPFSVPLDACWDHLVFTVQPTTTTAGDPITPPVQVSAMDGFGNTDKNFVGPVAVSIGANPSGGMLSGALTRAAVAGVASFSDLSIHNAGSGYTLIAGSVGLAATSSTAFNISPGAAARLVCAVQPSNPAPGTSIMIVVTAQDAYGNTATTFAGNVTATIGAPPGGSLSGTVTVTAVAGVAVFSDLAITAGSGYTLIVSSPGLIGATCGPF
jgi:hypothetical protein